VLLYISTKRLIRRDAISLDLAKEPVQSEKDVTSIETL